MKNNIIFLIIGSLMVMIPIIISLIIKYNNSHNKPNYNEKQNKYADKVTKDHKIENSTVYERIDKLEQEILKLKQENHTLREEYRTNIILSNQNTNKNSSFRPILNYNLFKEKNINIINLYENGKSKEEIAKILNKSIREVEMVIRLIK